MQYDRRKSTRLKVQLPVHWEGVLESGDATVTSLSLNGCFVLTGGKVQPRELIRLEIFLPAQPPAYVWAEVVEEAYEIGFAARFNSPSDDADQARLRAFIDTAQKKAK